MSTPGLDLVDVGKLAATAWLCVVPLACGFAIRALLLAGAFPARWWQRLMLAVHWVVLGAVLYRIGFLSLVVWGGLSFRGPDAPGWMRTVVLPIYVGVWLVNIVVGGALLGLSLAGLLWGHRRRQGPDGASEGVLEAAVSRSQEATRGNRRGHRSGLAITSWVAAPGLVLALLWLCSAGLWYGYGAAVCGRCLQHAWIFEWKVLGVVVSRSVEPSQAPGGLMSASAFSPAVPRILPGTYPAMRGKACDHIFLMGGCGLYDSRGGHWDVVLGDWQRHLPRIAAVESVYRAYSRVPSQSLATETLELIDEAYPIDRSALASGPLARCHLSWELGDRQPAADLDESTALAGALAAQLPRLASVSSEQDWCEVLEVLAQAK
jgi:hypothetical protein